MAKQNSIFLAVPSLRLFSVFFSCIICLLRDLTPIEALSKNFRSKTLSKAHITEPLVSRREFLDRQHDMGNWGREQKGEEKKKNLKKKGRKNDLKEKTHAISQNFFLWGGRTWRR